jgi:hypothetical protein
MQVDLVAKVRYSKACTMFRDRPAGWGWWFSARTPDGQDIVGVIKGLNKPFETKEAAVLDIETQYPGVQIIILSEIG